MKKKSIFIADSNLSYINDLTQKLSHEDDVFVVGYALNGSDAVQRIKMFQELDVLIIDLVLPGMDGYSVLKEIHDNKDQYPNIRLIIAQSSISNDHILNLVSNLGAHQVTKQ